MKIDVNKLKWNRESDDCCPQCGGDMPDYIDEVYGCYICTFCGHQFDTQD